MKFPLVFFFSEEQKCKVLGFENTSPYSLQSVSVDYVDELLELTAITAEQKLIKFITKYYTCSLFDLELGETTGVKNTTIHKADYYSPAKINLLRFITSVEIVFDSFYYN